MATIHEYVSTKPLGRCYNRYTRKLTTDQHVTADKFWDLLGKPPGQIYWLIECPTHEQSTLIDGVPHWTYVYVYDVDSSD